MSDVTLVAADFAVNDIERRGRSMPKDQWYRMLSIVIEELQLRKEAAADELRAEGVNVQEIED